MIFYGTDPKAQPKRMALIIDFEYSQLGLQPSGSQESIFIFRFEKGIGFGWGTKYQQN
jgi:hypothetical protein